jgi:uncharacterized protein YlzI (FlbEa/FlbD family)
MMQLQWLDDNGINQGDLYIPKINVSYVIHHRMTKETTLVLSNGKKFRIANPMREIQEESMRED